MRLLALSPFILHNEIRYLLLQNIMIILAWIIHRLLENESGMLLENLDHFLFYKSVAEVVGEQASRHPQAGGFSCCDLSRPTS